VAPSAVRWIARTLEEAGYETWVVGGAVRDALLGLPSPEEWDLTTRATPQQVRRLFRRTVPIGVEHGTVGVIARDGTMYEVTTFRKDVETDGRRAKVAFASSVEDDLARRDFTVNAMAWHPLREELLDPFGGAADLEAGLLRTVGEPGERIAEDFLRILRALRFAGRFGLAVEEETWRALCDATPRLRSLSAERVREELMKVLAADVRPSRALGLYVASGALRVSYPEIQEAVERGLDDNPDPWTRTMLAIDWLPPGRPLLRLTALLRMVRPAEAVAILMRLRFSNARVGFVGALVADPPLPRSDAGAAAFRRWLSAVGERWVAAVRLEMADARVRIALGLAGPAPRDVVAAWRRVRGVRAETPPLRVRDLALGGRDLIRLGLRPGPSFRTILAHLLELVLEDPALNRREILEREAMAFATSLDELDEVDEMNAPGGKDTADG